MALSEDDGTNDMEGGMTPGRETPVFVCDFGKIGVQICFDMEFDQGWEELARQGAELVVWPTQSPQTTHPAARALKHRYYIVSSTWRNNATSLKPTGKMVAQIKPPQRVLVEEIDLSYLILPWSRQLRNGQALKEKFGDKVGFRYYKDEDCGFFWSNDHQGFGLFNEYGVPRRVSMLSAPSGCCWIRLCVCPLRTVYSKVWRLVREEMHRTPK